MSRGLIFGYVVGLKLALNAYLVNIGIGPNLDLHDPQKGSKKIGPVCALYTLSLSLSCTSVITFLAPRCEFSVCYNFPNLSSKSFWVCQYGMFLAKNHYFESFKYPYV